MRHMIFDDADIIISSYGITSRVVETAVKSLREEGIKVGVYVR